LLGQTPRLLSSAEVSQVPAGGDGSSSGAILSADGRYVVFVSAANDLLPPSNIVAPRIAFPETLNVFLRDRFQQATTLISVNDTGSGGGDGDSVPVGISTNGQYVLFESLAANLVAGDTNQVADIFVRDLGGGTTILVSVGTNGVSANGQSRSATMTPDGRYIAFVSEASNLVVGDTNQLADVFVRDLGSATTTLVSVRGPNYWKGSSELPQISDDGRYVAYYSNSVLAGRTAGDVYVRDLVTGKHTCASQYGRTYLHSFYVASFNHALSADGRFLAYESAVVPGAAGVILRYDLETGQTDVVRTNAAVLGQLYYETRSLGISGDGRFIVFVANAYDGSGTNTCVQLWDAQSGQCTLVSGDPNNAVPTNSLCDWPALDPSGRYVSFMSTARGLVTNTLRGDYHLYLRDTQTGTTILLDGDANGAGSPVTANAIPSFSADGSLVVFDCADSELVANDKNHATDVFLREIPTGEVELISAHDPGLPSLTPNGASTINPNSLNADGRYLAFASEAGNLVANDTNGWSDVFVRDLAGNSFTLASMNTNGQPADGPSTELALSPDGLHVAFSSWADDLVPGDSNANQDVFLRDLNTGVTTIVSVGAPAAAKSYAPLVSSGGRYVLFRWQQTYGMETLVLRDVALGTNYFLNPYVWALAVPPSMSADGRFVAFAAPDNSSWKSGRVFLWDTEQAARIYTNTASSSFGVMLFDLTLMRDGSKLAFAVRDSTTNCLYVRRRQAQSDMLVDSSTSNTWQGLRFSGDGQWLVAVQVAAGSGVPKQVWLYDLQTGAKTLVSSSSPETSLADSPDISPDGRWVVYRSSQFNMLPGDDNNQPDLFLYDRLTGRTSLAVSASGTVPNYGSFLPLFSADGSTLICQTWASDLTPGDYNQTCDILGQLLRNLVLVPGIPADSGWWLTWPCWTGDDDRVEYTHDLGDPQWLELGGTVTNSGTKAWIHDLSPGSVQRFYRLRSR